MRSKNADPLATSPPTFFWYDLETSGTHPPSDRIMQFAGWRTDMALRPLGEACATYVRLAPDVLPSPEACLVTGITPQRANAEGVDEWQALREAERLMRQANTCVVGYNNLRFDDDFLRFGFYRNLLDPYAREWQDGNSRWDLIDVVRATCALRPEGIEWPRDDGVVTFRLDRLSVANGIAHDHAHDALNDVRATIDLARLVRKAQPKLWRYAFARRFRHAAAELLEPLGARPCVYVSRRFPNERRCAAPVASVAAHPTIRGRVVVADLARDVDVLLDCDAAEIAERLFAPDAEFEERPPLAVVATNRCPFLAPLSVVRPDDAKRLGFDLEAAERRRRVLAGAAGLAEKLAAVYRPDDDRSETTDAEFALYDGFAEDADRQAAETLQTALAAGADWPAFRPGDARFAVLGERLKARLRPDELADDERRRWRDHVRRCLREGFGKRPSLDGYRREIAELLQAEPPPAQRRLLEELAAYEPPP